MSDLLHRITWDGDHGEFHCDGDRTSPCHNYPPCECEAWYEEELPDGTTGHQHQSTIHDECWQLPWLQAGTPEDCYTGDPFQMERRDSLIETTFETDCLLWDYAGDPS